MKLLVDCHVFDGKFQGTRTYLQGLYSAMVGYSGIDFFFAAKDVENLKTIFGYGDNIHYIQLSSSGSVKRLAVEYPEIIKENNIDYAHFQYVSPFKKNCKEIITTHDVLFLDFPEYFPLLYRIKNGLLFRFSAKKADVLLTVSEYSKNAISKHFSIEKNAIHITPNAVIPCERECENTNFCEKHGLKKFLLSVGRIEPRKNFLSLLKAFVELALFEKGYKLVFVGTPDLRYKEFGDYYSSLSTDVQKQVLFVKASFGELVELYKKTSLFVFPSFAEGFGIPPLEAIEFESPILCSNATAMSEFSLPENMMFDPHNIEEMKRKILLNLDEKKIALELKDRFKKRYSWKCVAESFYKMLVSVG